MKFAAHAYFLIALAATFVSAQTNTPFKHVIVIVQENRTPDNLFAGGTNNPMTWDIQQFSAQASGVPLASCIDPDHNHLPQGWTTQYNGGNYNNWCATSPGCIPVDGLKVCPQETFVNEVDVDPYFQIARNWGFANRMFQTNQGPSFPAHQFLLSGTSTPTTNPPYNAWFAAENPVGTGSFNNTGCTAPVDQFVRLVDTSGSEGTCTKLDGVHCQTPCFEHQNLTDLLDTANISWKWYAPNPGSIWTAPNSINHICVPQWSGSGSTQKICTGQDWTQNVILYPPQVLNDINNPDCKSFPQVSWVIPSFPYSDHGGTGINGMGPDWVADIVQAVGNNGVNQCNYWSNTAIVITWDDWGGFYDHVQIPQPFRNQYELGFRVPLLFVSAYTPAGFVSCPVPVGDCKHLMDFGSILQFIEVVFGLPLIGPGTYADALARPLDPGFYSLQSERQFTPVTGLTHDASYFTTNQVSPSQDPDDD